MLIGVPKEIKNHEYRVGMTPLSVREAVRHGHKVIVETSAGAGIGASDEDYKKAGATIIKTGGGNLRPRRHDREGEGAAGGRAQDACARDRSSTPTCIWRRIRNRPRIS